MNYLLEEVINFIQKTKERCIVLDQKANFAYVIMPFGMYKNFIGGAAIKDLSEDELLEKINRDIALWKSAQDAQNRPEWESLTELSEAVALKRSGNQDISQETGESSKTAQTKEEVKDRYYFEPIE